MKRIAGYLGKYLICAGMILGMVLFSSSVERTPLVPEDGTEFAKAIVIEASNEMGDDLLTEAGQGESQEVTVSIRSGKHKGETVEGYNLNGYLYGANCQVGTKVIVKLSEYEGVVSASVYNYDRELQIGILVLLFLGSIWFVGGKKGFNSVLALVFTFLVVILLYIPMLYVGIHPFLAAVIAAILITVMTHVLIADFSRKSISAMVGTVGGVVVAGLIALVFGKTAHITGYNVDDIETMVYIAQNSKIKISGILFSGIIISSLGAVMDVAMSIASSLNELHEKMPEISRKELFQSGMMIGRDMISTMSNTLILAYVGSSVNLMVMIYAYSYQMHQILNLYSLGIEIMNGLAGSLGIILTVPFTAALTALIMKKPKKA